MAEDTTLDGFLNRRLMVEQPKIGYRAAIDTVLLAAAVPAKAGEQVIEFGCGAGVASLCVGWRVDGLQMVGIELQADMVALAQRNVERNAMASFIAVQQGDVRALPNSFAGRFDQVMMNPPYHEASRHDVSAHMGKRLANSESNGDLKRWIDSAAAVLKPGGGLTLVHRADRMDEIFGLLRGSFGKVEIIRLLAKAGGEAKRVIVRARCGVDLNSEPIIQEFVLHQGDGSYSPAADAILRDSVSLDSVMT